MLDQRWPRSWASWRRRGGIGAVLLVVAVAAGVAAESGASSRAAMTKHRATTTILVWPDATRVPAFKAYAKTHPNVHLQIVTRDAGTNGAATLQAKINLFNRTGHGWPDIVFVDPNDISWLSSAPYDYAAPLDGMIPKKTIQGYPGSVLSGVCEIGGKLYCLRNDLAQDVLWYNAKLMRQFGYQVPKTWEQYRQLGLKVARQHPGYVVGALGTTPPQTYFEASRCPMHTIVGENKLLIDPASPHCTRMINLLDSLLKAGSVTPLSELGADFVKKYGATNKILMLYGASWYGEYLFHQAYHSPAGLIAAAPPPRWAGEPKAYTGQVGGGIYVISKHAADPKAAADVINWVSTNPQYQLTAPTYPAYGPVAAKWLQKQSNEKYFASSVAPAFKTAAEQIWGDYGFVKINDLGIWSSAVVPKITQGGTLASAWKSFGEQLEQQAKINGYQVVSK
jgi:multiple sugar transport system substrate-binding protein